MVVAPGTTSPQPPKMHENKTSDITFVQALHDIYVDQEIVDNRLVLPKDRNLCTDITFVGFGKLSTTQRQLKKLFSIDLSSRRISSAGDIVPLCGALDRVKTVNLARNNLNWSEVIKIIQCLPNLRDLILSENPTLFSEDFITFPKTPYPSLYMLTLGQIGFTWINLMKVLPKIWLKVDQIDLWDNNLTIGDLNPQLTNNDDFTLQISTLRLSHNNLSSMALADFGPLNNIIELDLSWCQLTCMEIDLACPNIRVLNISHNNISDCAQVAKLNLLTKLTHLICFDNPFYVDDKLAKHFTIARIKSLKLLNRELVSANTRRDSEILYVRKLYPQFKEFKSGKKSDFPSCNPRYPELVEIYGLPEDVNEKVQDRYITVTLRSGKVNHKKKLPRDMSVSNLQVLCRRLFRFNASSHVIIECCRADPTNNYTLESKEQTLHFYSIGDGQTLLVNEVD